MLFAHQPDIAVFQIGFDENSLTACGIITYNAILHRGSHVHRGNHSEVPFWLETLRRNHPDFAACFMYHFRYCSLKDDTSAFHDGEVLTRLGNILDNVS